MKEEDDDKMAVHCTGSLISPSYVISAGRLYQRKSVEVEEDHDSKRGRGENDGGQQA